MYNFPGKMLCIISREDLIGSDFVRRCYGKFDRKPLLGLPGRVFRREFSRISARKVLLGVYGERLLGVYGERLLGVYGERLLGVCREGHPGQFPGKFQEKFQEKFPRNFSENFYICFIVFKKLKLKILSL